MSYTLTIDQNHSYLHAVITGRNTRENVEGYLRELVAECQARDCFRVLVEERLEGPRLRLLDVFELATMGSDLGRGTLKAVAFVDIYAEGGLMKFAEDVAVNRGIPMAVFDTVAEAETWLKQGDCSPA
jgi:hypothetical protein